jgi:hypothetical protein
MRNVFGWLLIAMGLILAVGGAGMIVIGFLTNPLKLSPAVAGLQ